MNDNSCVGCFWWECGACDGADKLCEMALTLDSKKYKDYYSTYECDVEKALVPIVEKWKTIFNDEFNKCDVK